MKSLFNRPWIISVLLIVALSAWMTSGMLNAQQKEPAAEPETKSEEEILPKVRVKPVKLEQVTQLVVLYGRTEPGKSTTLKSEISGRITELMVEKGERVKKGQAIAKIDLNDRDKQLDHARAKLKQKQIEYEGSKSLSQEGYQGRAKLAQSYAELKESEVMVALLEKEIKNTVIRAAFDGVIDERPVEVGDYVNTGNTIAQLINLDPLIVRGNVSQHDINAIHVGQTARVKLTTGETRNGKVRFLSSQSNSDTNTFRLEVAVNNPDLSLLAGLSAEIELPQNKVEAVKISPALFSLNDAGEIGVKWVRDERVHFSSINIVKTETDGSWITGIPAEVSLITVGQAFVKEGDKVIPSTEQQQNESTEAEG